MKAGRLLAVLVVAAVSGIGSSLAAGPGGVEDIHTFIDCLDTMKRANPASGTIADAVHCVPPRCNFTVTMSSASAQRACTLGGCALPRVIFSCPGPAEGKRFRPSFLLCPTGSRDVTGQLGVNRVELGEDVNEVGDMKMGDVAVPPATDFTRFTDDEVLSKVGQGNKGCNGCHRNAGVDADNNQLSGPIDPFGLFAGTDVSPCVIDTNEPGKTVAPNVTPFCPLPHAESSLDDVCECMEEHEEEIAQEATMAEDVEIVLRLCRRLAVKIHDSQATPRPGLRGSP